MSSDPCLRFEDLPLGERKRARTRLALLDALLSRIEQIPVKELCAEVEWLGWTLQAGLSTRVRTFQCVSLSHPL
ncbi:MAG TPA: hypothetical protein ENI94_09125 [Gammaproteobacteria bacterium]|nr:hypothetical protein [Gammaproteobacteria bacterium]